MVTIAIIVYRTWRFSVFYISGILSYQISNLNSWNFLERHIIFSLWLLLSHTEPVYKPLKSLQAVYTVTKGEQVDLSWLEKIPAHDSCVDYLSYKERKYFYIESYHDNLGKQISGAIPIKKVTWTLFGHQVLYLSCLRTPQSLSFLYNLSIDYVVFITILLSTFKCIWITWCSKFSRKFDLS